MQRFLAAAALASFALPGAAGAATVTILYEITGGLVTGDTDPETVTGGQFRVTLPAATTNSLLSGAGTLQSFSVMADGVSRFLGFASTRITLRLTNKPSVEGNRFGYFIARGTPIFAGTLRQHCIAPGTICTYYGYFPPYSVSVPSLVAFSAADNLPTSVFRFNALESAGLLLSNFGGGGTGFFALQFFGEEVERVFMPEPGGNWLAVTALASLSGMALLRTRRRRVA